MSAKEHIKKLIENNSLNIATLHISFHVPVFVYIHIEIDISKMRKMRSPDREVLISDEPEPEFSSSSHEGSEPSQAELGHFNFRAESEPNQKVPGLKKSKSPGTFFKVRGLPSPFFSPFFLDSFTCHQRYYMQSS